LGRRVDLQAKIVFVLIAVILPTFLIITIAENELTRPILEEEIRENGISLGKTLAAEIDSSRLLQLPNPTLAIESRLQELAYAQPNLTRLDVFEKDPNTSATKLVASNIEEDPASVQVMPAISESITSEFRTDEAGAGFWDISVPIEHRARDPRGLRRLLGVVHVAMTTKIVGGLVRTLWRTTATAAGFSVIALIASLSYFLRKTINNDRLLREAESQNLQLTEQLHETERQLMNTEKFAVMGQLTASFAHEIGTPLNAIGGHLQLLKEDLSLESKPLFERVGIINGQLAKIEQIVKNFLQSTAKPTSQRQLVDLNKIADKTVSIVQPRTEAMKVEVRRALNREMGPLRVVPLEMEQVLLNLVNNSLDSIRSKLDRRSTGRMVLELATEVVDLQGKLWAQISVYDTGEGINKADFKNVLKPFFTTKSPNQGTGLGLTITQQLVHKYGGELLIDSKEGAWTRVTVQLPYEVNV